MATSSEHMPPVDPEIHSLREGSRRGDSSASDGMSLIVTISVLLRHPRILFWVPLFFAMAAVYVARVRGLEYNAQSQFEPRSSETGSIPFTGLASQFGINLNSLSGGQGIEFYAKVLQSNELLRAAVLNEYTFSTRDIGLLEGDTLSGNLVELLESVGETEEARLLATVRNVNSRVAVRSDLRAGVVVLNTTAPWPELAVQLNRSLLDLLNDFNLQTRQSQAAAERVFVEGRLEETRLEYEEAEDAVLRFQEANRRFRDSPELALEAERLQRQVSHQQQIYTTLQQAYERARIDEVRNTPVITIVEAPEGNVQQAGGLVLYALLGIIVGGMIAIGMAFVADHLGREQALYPDAFVEFRELRRTAARRLLPGNLVKRKKPL